MTSSSVGSRAPGGRTDIKCIRYGSNGRSDSSAVRGLARRLGGADFGTPTSVRLGLADVLGAIRRARGAGGPTGGGGPARRAGRRSLRGGACSRGAGLADVVGNRFA